MLKICQNRTGWIVPYILIGALIGIALTTSFSPAATLRFATADQFNYGEQFNQILRTLREKHVNQDAVKSDAELFHIAIDAIIKEVGDAHGSYFSQEEFNRMQQMMRPTAYGGIGISLAPGSEGLVILEIFDNSPINQTSIRVGDIITGGASLGEPLVEWNSETPNADEVIGAIKGTVGTDVSIQIKRNGQPLGVFTVERITARQQTVFSSLSETGILTIRMHQFTTEVTSDLLRMLRNKGLLIGNNLNTNIVRGVVLDLRNNPGGALISAVKIGNLFLPKGKNVVRVIEPPHGDSELPTAFDYPAESGRFFPKAMPRVILVNGGSASASEIVAGAAQAHNEGLIMGVKSYGKGSVQEIHGISGGAGFKTTVAIYLAGGTMEIDGIGVTPDALVLQPAPIGATQEDQILNSILIKNSLDPELDHQLHVAHTYINNFISGVYDFSDPEARRDSLNNAHGAVTNINSGECKAKGLRGCPPDELSLMETDAPGWMSVEELYGNEWQCDVTYTDENGWCCTE